MRRCASSGNTSAYAEKTCPGRSHFYLAQKHLRLRGENGIISDTGAIGKETPPLTRRKLTSCLTTGGTIGNTSAYAEKTLAKSVYEYDRRKHLRLRGENLDVPAEFSGTERNTSAYAEKTKSEYGMPLL